jgi:hypothetical protein
MKSSFLLGYKYIFCPPSRRSRQITVRALEIVYSFCSFACSSSFTWQHSPDSSFSWVCSPQHFVLSIDILHIPLCNHNYYTNRHHTNPNALLKNSDNCNYNFCTSLLINILKKPLCKFFPPFFNHFLSPQCCRRIYQYLPFSTHGYPLHSILYY